MRERIKVVEEFLGRGDQTFPPRRGYPPQQPPRIKPGLQVYAPVPVVRTALC